MAYMNICNKKDKHDHQGKAAYNERNPPHDTATQDHRQGAQQSPNKNRTGQTTKHGRLGYTE
jgi:hypothetical protein